MKYLLQSNAKITTKLETAKKYGIILLIVNDF